MIPGSVPGETLIVRTDQAAVALGSIRAYPNGFEFTLNVRLREEDELWLGADPFEWRGRRRDRRRPGTSCGWASCTSTGAGPRPTAARGQVTPARPGN